MPENISNEQRTAILIRKYDITNKFDNTVLGVFIGIISGIKIEAFMNNENNFSKWVLIGCCIVSVIFLIVAICINSSFASKCLELANQSSYRDSKTIRKDVSNSRVLQLCFWLCLSLSLVIFCIGIYKFKPAFSHAPTQTTCPWHTQTDDSVK